jgi:hypothetical protein
VPHSAVHYAVLCFVADMRDRRSLMPLIVRGCGLRNSLAWAREVEGTVKGRDPWVRAGPVYLAQCTMALIERRIGRADVPMCVPFALSAPLGQRRAVACDAARSVPR